MIWCWYFFSYSFLGFLLEICFARATGGRRDRKCLLILPLCPVYGAGACAILLLPPVVLEQPALLFLLGGLTATAVEYAMAVFYERGLGVCFWDYSGLPGNLQGWVCLPFSLAWGTLALGLARWVQPAVAQAAAMIPNAVTWCAMATLAADVLISSALLYRTGDRTCLQWYRPGQHAA